LHRIDPALVDLARVETNIVQLETRSFGRPAAVLVADLHARGVLAGVWSKWVMRMVTHRHIGAAEIDETVSAIGELWRGRAGNA
jgi:threonine aldolase